MFGHAIRRLGLAGLSMLLLSLLVVGGTTMLPGDSCTAYLGQAVEPGALAACRHEFGLERPMTVRYAEWLSALVKGDLGRSLKLRQPVAELLAPRVRNTLVLAGLAAIVGVPLALALGVMAAIFRDRFPDLLVSALSIVLMTVPEFVSATLLILVFAIKLRWAPAVTIVPPGAPLRELLPSLGLPAGTLVLVLIAHVLRVARAATVEALESEHVEMARLKGVSPINVLFRHALPGAAPTMISIVALTLAWLLGGVVIVERVFNYPGLGTLMVQAIYDRDMPLLQAITLIFAATYIVLALLSDLLAMTFNPRLRRAGMVRA